MPSRAQFKEISKARLKEVKTLLKGKHYEGARYLLGYVIEAALKARICKILDSDYPDTGDLTKVYFTHDFDRLIKLAGLQKKLDEFKNINLDFDTNWSLLTGWSEKWRYDPIGNVTESDVKTLLDALEDDKNGVLTWIKKLW